MSIKFTLPIYWTKHYKTKADKTVLVSMNWYRNAHYFDQNRFKQEFSAMIAEQLENCLETKAGRFMVNYKVWYKNPNSDPSNIVALIEKVTLDTLQELGHLENDNFKYHVGSNWKVMDKDIDEPRCEIELTEIKDLK